MRRTAPLLTIAAALLLSGCRATSPGSMVNLPPPPAWAERLVKLREAKDAAFRRGPDSPLRADAVAGFEGLDYWEPDRSLYFAGPLHVYPRRERFSIVTTAGQTRPCERFGWIEFPIAGVHHRLQVYRLLDMGRGMSVDSLLLPFADGTTGGETYPSGRYIDLAGPAGELQLVTGPDGTLEALGPWVLDFNRAYNPSCAYGAPERFACPVTPPDNRLEVRIEAGERGWISPDKLPSG
jgi:uncharacterized protein (DUF1684 family)